MLVYSKPVWVSGCVGACVRACMRACMRVHVCQSGRMGLFPMMFDLFTNGTTHKHVYAIIIITVGMFTVLAWYNN